MTFAIGDLVVLSSGSMRMCVESVEGEKVNCVWCHEGSIGRDSFAPALLRKWETREDDNRKSGDGYNKGKPYGGDRGDRGDRGGSRGGPRGKTGWDGKPREKSHFRKD